MSDADLPERLRQQLHTPWQSRDARARMAPRLSYGRHQGPPNPNAKIAAVLILLVRRDDEWCVPLTKRQPYLPDHPGQISLPGGLIEPGESAEQGALRESEEEIGIAASQITLLGSLAELNLYNSNFRVLPSIGVLRGEPNFRSNEAEVAELFEIPLSKLTIETADSIKIRRGSLSFSAPCYTWLGHQVWGETSIMLSEFAALTRSVQG